MKAAIVAMYPTLDLRLFKELSATTTALIGLEKELIQFDEMNASLFYLYLYLSIFGVLTVKEQQTTEEEWFSNSGLSCACERFLGLLGTRVELKGYSGYAAGLDTKTGESGLVSYVSRWEHHPIMYHVGPLMPLRNDKQQIHRKRYIGNDIVCVVFMEGKHSAFDPNTVTSQFLHVFIVVSPEHQQDKEIVQVMANKTIEEFGPCLPSPPLFDQHELHHFLTLKCRWSV
ncbi:hypothetical protein BDF14DRAFT_1717872 [Spinellus fusiger]|nr:hypothetical protein BDF14DRAFT_1717872 [Spinellus fusiger]